MCVAFAGALFKCLPGALSPITRMQRSHKRPTKPRSLWHEAIALVPDEEETQQIAMQENGRCPAMGQAQDLRWWGEMTTVSVSNISNHKSNHKCLGPPWRHLKWSPLDVVAALHSLILCFLVDRAFGSEELNLCHGAHFLTSHVTPHINNLTGSNRIKSKQIQTIILKYQIQIRWS